MAGGGGGGLSVREGWAEAGQGRAARIPGLAGAGA